MTTQNQLNFLLPSKASLDVYGSVNFSITVQNFKIPRIYGFIAEHPTPHLTVPIPGNKLVYDELEVSFIVTENMESYLELHKWIRGIYAPYGAPEYKNKKQYLEEIVLTVYSAANNPILKIRFIDAFPIKLDEVIFDVQTQTADPIKSKVGFAFRNFDIEYVT